MSVDGEHSRVENVVYAWFQMQFLHRTVMPWSILGHSCFSVEVNLVNIQKRQIKIKKWQLQFKKGFSF